MTYPIFISLTLHALILLVPIGAAPKPQTQQDRQPLQITFDVNKPETVIKSFSDKATTYVPDDICDWPLDPHKGTML